MIDFLTSLTARSFGTETAIRPRVASLFEPVRNGDAALREVPAAEPIESAIAREADVESGGERKLSRPMLAWREDGRASVAKDTANGDPVSAIGPQPRGDLARRVTTVGADERWEEDDSVVAAKVRPPRAPLSRGENSNQSHPLLRSDSGDDAPKGVPTRELAASPTQNESFEKENRGVVLPPKAVTELTAQMKNAALAMNIKPGVPARDKAGSASQALATEPEPSVHVTIGRIEVRAISESKHAGQPRPASRVMSLEEYLHRRTQRGGQ
jgi:hypothetical protein